MRIRTVAHSLSVIAVLVSVTAAAQEPPAPNKCDKAKLNCVRKFANCALAVDAKALGKGELPDGEKLAACVSKFADPEKGCLLKAEKKQKLNKPETICSSTDNAVDLQGVIDEFVASASTIVTTGDPDSLCCQPSCAGRSCGSDGCGEPCGTCEDGLACNSEGQCVHVPESCLPQATPGCDGCDCEACVCELDPYCCETAWDGLCVSECVESCGETACDGCVPSCAEAECGDDNCGGSCGSCAESQVCAQGQCCTPDCDGKACGNDGCGGSCGSCAGSQTCASGRCCTPDCSGKECGDDGCGGSCSNCGEGSYCDDEGQCVEIPEMCVARDAPGCDGCACEQCVCELDSFCCEIAWDGRCVGACVSECGETACDDSCVPFCGEAECGDDNCGGSCGECSPGYVCTFGECVTP